MRWGGPWENLAGEGTNPESTYLLLKAVFFPKTGINEAQTRRIRVYR